jgi:branched-chain amino acid aminotransferase
LTDAEFGDRIAETIVAASLSAPAGVEWYIRVLLTRGVGDLTYDPAATPTPSVVTIVKPFADPAAELYARGVRVVLSSIIRNHPDTVNPMIKSNNLMNCALAMQEGYRRGAFEVIMRNYRGEIAECSTSNLFIVKSGIVVTPPLSAGLLPGITRAFLFEVGASAGVAVREAVLKDDDLYSADEVFLTGTTREIMPIVQVEDRMIGSGLPGAVTRNLHTAFQRLARTHAGP